MRDIIIKIDGVERRELPFKRTSHSYDRIKGLMFKDVITFGLLIKPCNSIHTAFMRTRMDACFFDSKGNILNLIKEMKPWRHSKIYFKARGVLELPAGYIDKLDVKVGSRLEFQDV